MKGYLTKSMYVAMVAAATLVFSPALIASAKTLDFKPKLERSSGMDIASRAVILHFDARDDLKNTDVAVKIRVRNKVTGAVTFQTRTTHVNGDGEGRIMVKSLAPNTAYDFKIRVRKLTIEDFSKYSRTRSFTTVRAAAATTDVEPTQ